MNKMQKLAKDALDVQDACNAVAVCKGFDRVLTQLRELGVSWASETMSALAAGHPSGQRHGAQPRRHRRQVGDRAS